MMKTSTFAQRLRAGLDARHMTQAELSSRSQILKSSISHYLKGDWEGKQDAVYSLAQALEVSEAWLMGYDVPMAAARTQSVAEPIPPGFIPMPKVKKVPLIDASADPITNKGENVNAPDDIRCDFAFECRGDSMVGAGIHHGDVVYLHSQSEVENGDIVAVRIGDEVTLKRVYFHTDHVELRPKNPEFESVICQKENMKIEGRVVGWTHWV